MLLPRSVLSSLRPQNRSRSRLLQTDAPWDEIFEACNSRGVHRACMRLARICQTHLACRGERRGPRLGRVPRWFAPGRRVWFRHVRRSLCLTLYITLAHSYLLSRCSVPLDYHDAGAGVAKITLARYNATAAPRKGSVFVNPGGPGGSGVGLAAGGGDSLQSFVRTMSSIFLQSRPYEGG